ncbi:hypothetical protein LguiA_030938 [Lonicera macranthoides]
MEKEEDQTQTKTNKLQTKSSTQLDEVPITLRSFNLSDVDDLMIWATDEKVCQFFCGWEPATFAPREKVTNIIENYIIPHPYFRSICVNDRSIGDVSVNLREGCESCRANIGYVVASDYWGKGIATKALKMAVSEIFEKFPNLERIEGCVDAENVASQRVLEKCGFKREGVFRKYLIHKGKAIDMVMFSLLNTDPRI